MKFGIIFANTGPFARPERAAELARAAEAVGFESLWTVEHVVVPSGYESTYPYDPSGKMPGADDAPIPDPLVWLSYLAGVTSRITLATGILILPQRNPVVLAKELATLDVLSAGRVRLGIGVGWMREEFDALGVGFDDRAARTDDAVAAMRALWRDEKATHNSDYVRFTDCVLSPRPANGSIPVVVGGHSEAAARRAGRIGDGFFPGKGSHTALASLFELAKQTAREHGRDPDAIELTSGGRGVFGEGALDEVKALADLGVDRVVVPAFLFYNDTADALARFAEQVIGAAGV